MTEDIAQLARSFDEALAARDLNGILAGFAGDAEIKVLGQTLTGRTGVLKWINWFFHHIDTIEFEPITVMTDGPVLFEEFTVHARFYNGVKVDTPMSEVLVFEQGKIKNLRLYFDRLEFSESMTRGVVSRVIVKNMIRDSLKGLT